jgi:PAS domain S-box-containing protein
MFVSDNWSRHMGQSPIQSQGRPLLEFIHSEDHDLLREHFTTTLPSGPVNQKLRYLDGSGRTRWIQLDLHEAALADGSSGYVGLLTDITDRVGREASLLAQHRTLSGILDDLPGMVFRCRNDPDWTMEYVSEGSLSLTGYRPGEIINNRRLSYGSLIVDEDREKVWNGVQLAIRERRGYDIDYRIETESGDVRHVWERGKGMFSTGNDLLGLEGFITDITRYQQRFLPPGLAHLYLEDGISVARPLLEDRIAHRMHRLSEARKSATPDAGFALLCIHFDNFGAQLDNATHRVHAMGLSTLAKRVFAQCTAADSLNIDITGRILLLVDQARERALVESLAASLEESFLEPVELDTLQLFLTLSIGAVWCPKPVASESLVQTAERCMLQLHETGGRNWRVVTLGER